jgi:preprotein translocase subunit SecD
MSVRTKFILILILTVAAVFLAYPREDRLLSTLGIKNVKLQIRQGLDLQGGAHLVYQADTSKLGGADKEKALSSLVDVIQRRVNPSGTSEIVVQVAGSDRVIVELPGVKDLTEAINTIGKTAELNFIELSQAGEAPTGITGKDVDRADVDFDTQTGRPIVTLQMKAGDSTKRFAEATTRINQSGTQLVTMLDQDIIFGPASVSNAITDGRAQLQGNFTVNDAKQIAQLINAGALPVPVSLVEQRTVGATLGQDSIQRSLLAGIIGLLMVALFMILYYRLAGAVAVVALLLYGLLVLVVFKLSAVTPYPIVLTLAGIAGFILSIGEAVDANVLIFERFKEEVRSGKSILSALEAGFDRAWTSIRDSNAATIIICVILYNFGVPTIKGFAVVLIIGTLASLFTSLVVSRTLLRMVVRTSLGSDPKWWGVSEEAKVVNS